MQNQGVTKKVSPLDTLQGDERCLRLEDLLPGIPNHITLDEIASKMSWKGFHVLSSVSRGWRHAIRSRQVYEARVRAETRETLALISCGGHGDSCEILIYSTRDKSCYVLPPILSLRTGGIPLYTQCVSLDGKVYLIGCENGCSDNHPIHNRRHVYVLDLAGQGQWKQCASMMVERSSMKCGVSNGKIFVFGVFTDSLDGGCGGEVYDPKENTWSPIKTVMYKGAFHELTTVEAVGQELFLYGFAIPKRVAGPVLWPEEFLEWSVYHPVTDEWGEVKKYFDYFNSDEEVPFAAQGRLHTMSTTEIFILDVGNSWTELHRFSYAVWLSSDDKIIAVKAVEDELLVLTLRRHNRIYLLQTKGFSSDQMEIQIEKVPVDFCSGDHFSVFNLASISLLQL